MSNVIEKLRLDVTKDPILLEKFLKNGVSVDSFLSEAADSGYGVSDADVREVHETTRETGLAKVRTAFLNPVTSEIVELDLGEVALVSGGLSSSIDANTTTRPSPVVVLVIGVVAFAGVAIVAAAFVVIAI
jgi:hypothetical protein